MNKDLDEMAKELTRDALLYALDPVNGDTGLYSNMSVDELRKELAERCGSGTLSEQAIKEVHQFQCSE